MAGFNFKKMGSQSREQEKSREGKEYPGQTQSGRAKEALLRTYEPREI